MARTPRPANLAVEITELRIQRVALLDRLEALRASPIALREAESRIDALLDQAERDAREWLSFESLVSVSGGSRVNLDTAATRTPLGLQLVLGGRPAIRAALLKEAAALIGDRGVDEAVREGTERKIRAEILVVEIAEEAICRDAEAVGAPIVRRPDADPAVFLREYL